MRVPFYCLRSTILDVKQIARMCLCSILFARSDFHLARSFWGYPKFKKHPLRFVCNREMNLFTASVCLKVDMFSHRLDS